jgi:outer membrane protein OmpA-like peptidoglycan-associated protein
MANIWSELGEPPVAQSDRGVFDPTFLHNVSENFSADRVTNFTVSDQERERASASIDTSALLKQTLVINFQPNVAILEPDAYPVLDEFLRTARLLNGSIIQIEGNIADVGSGQTETGIQLSENRAKAVYDYFVSMGIESSRMVYKGNGISNPVPGLDARSEEGQRANRRTDIFFLKLE